MPNILRQSEVKGKGKITLEQVTKAPRGSRSITLSFTSALDGEGGQRHAPAALPPEKTRCPWRLGSPQDRSGRVLKVSPPIGIRSPDRPARSKSLYRLSCPGPQFWDKAVVIFFRVMISNVECLDSLLDFQPLKMNLPHCFEMSDTTRSVTSSKVQEERRLQFQHCKPTYCNYS